MRRTIGSCSALAIINRSKLPQSPHLQPPSAALLFYLSHFARSRNSRDTIIPVKTRIDFSTTTSVLRTSVRETPSGKLASLSSSSEHDGTSSHRRRRSSIRSPARIEFQKNLILNEAGATYGSSPRGTGLPSIPGTPAGTMSLSRSPSPRAAGGWSSPGLTADYNNMSNNTSTRSPSPRKAYGDLHPNGSASGSGVTWASAEAKSEKVNGYPAFSTRNSGWFSRHARDISSSLPKFSLGGGKRDYSDKEKLGRGRWTPHSTSKLGRMKTLLGSITRRMRLRVLLVLGLILAFVLFWVTRKYQPLTFSFHHV